MISHQPEYETPQAQAERHHRDRYEWHKAAMAQNEQTTQEHAGRTKRMLIALAIRPVIEAAILVTLWLKL